MFRLSSPNVTWLWISRMLVYAWVADGHVEEHQVHAGHGQHQEQEERQPAQAERVRELDRVLADPHRVDVQEDVVHDRVRARALVARVGLAEERAPHDASAHRVIHPLEETHRVPPATPGVPASCASRYDSL